MKEIYGEERIGEVEKSFQEIFKYDPTTIKYNKEVYERIKEKNMNETGKKYSDTQKKCNERYHEKNREELNRKKRERYHEKKKILLLEAVKVI
jgi:hypothetical protein